MNSVTDENAMQVEVLTPLTHSTDSVKVYGFHSGTSTDKSIETDVNGNLMVSVVNSTLSTNDSDLNTLIGNVDFATQTALLVMFLLWIPTCRI